MSLRELNKKLEEFYKLHSDMRSQVATRWLATNLSKIHTPIRPDNYNKMRPSSDSPLKYIEGCMLFFGYQPKTKDVLPFWDEYPLVIVLKKTGKSILGLNLHYLSPSERATFLNLLIKTVDNPNYYKSSPSYIKATYFQLKTNKYLHKCIKRYYISNIKTRVNVIPSPEWKIVTFIPIDRFMMKSKEFVWSGKK